MPPRQDAGMNRQKMGNPVDLSSAFVGVGLVVWGCGLNRGPNQSGKKAVDQTLFQALPLTAEGLFTKGIEGPACDREGNIYAVNFAREHTIGKVTPEGKAEVFVEL